MDFRVLQGVSRAALADRDHQEMLARQAQADRRNTQTGFESYLKMAAEHPLMPEGAKTVAMHALIDTAMKGDKVTDKDYKYWNDQLWRSTMRPAPMTAPEQATLDAGSQAQSAAPNLDQILPGAGTAYNNFAGQEASKVPTGSVRPQISGLLTQPEVAAQQDSALRRQLGIHQEFSVPKFMDVPEGGRLYNTRTNQVVAEGNPKTRLPVEKEIDYDRAMSLYATEHKMDPAAVRSNPTLAAEAERSYADRTGRTPKPPSPYMMSEPLVPVYDSVTGQTIYTPRSQAAGKPAPASSSGVAPTQAVIDKFLKNPQSFFTATPSEKNAYVVAGGQPIMKLDTKALDRQRGARSGLDVINDVETLVDKWHSRGIDITGPVTGRYNELTTKVGSNVLPTDLSPQVSKEYQADVSKIQEWLSAGKLQEAAALVGNRPAYQTINMLVTPAAHSNYVRIKGSLSGMRQRLDAINNQIDAEQWGGPENIPMGARGGAPRLNSGVTGPATHRYVPGKGVVPIGTP